MICLVCCAAVRHRQAVSPTSVFSSRCAITGRGTWVQKPVGLGAAITGDTSLQGARRGDILHIKNSPQNHHVLLAREVPPGAQPSDPVAVIEGNIDAQEIAETTRWTVADIDLYYPAM